jgi:hypothetical protein
MNEMNTQCANCSIELKPEETYHFPIPPPHQYTVIPYCFNCFDSWTEYLNEQFSNPKKIKFVRIDKKTGEWIKPTILPPVEKASDVLPSVLANGTNNEELYL